MTHDVELAEDEHRLSYDRSRKTSKKGRHVSQQMPARVAVFIRAEEVEERVEGVRRASLPAPHQPLAREVVDGGDVDVPALSGDLINADVGQMDEVPLAWPKATASSTAVATVPGGRRNTAEQLPGTRRAHVASVTSSACVISASHAPRDRLAMHAGAARAPHCGAARSAAPPAIRRHSGPVVEAPCCMGVSVRAPRPTLAASGHEAAIPGAIGQSARGSSPSRPETRSFHRRLDQTFQERVSSQIAGCVTTPKYLGRTHVLGLSGFPKDNWLMQ